MLEHFKHTLTEKRWGRAVFYGWWLTLLALVVNACVTSPVWGGIGIWVASLETEFGWSRTQLAIAFSIGQLEGSIVAPAVGFLVDKFGSRMLIFLGTLVLGIGFLLFSFVTNLPMFYISFAIIMLGSSMGAWMPLMAAINKWFDRKRSLAMGIASSGFSIGGVLILPVIAWAVVPEHMGWQSTARWMGMLFLIIAWPLSRLVRNRPEDYQQLPDGAISSHDRTLRTDIRGEIIETGMTVRQAIQTRAFWLLAIGQGFAGMALSTLTVHMIPSLIDQGITLQTASFVWATMLGTAWIAQLIGGYFGDRVRKNLAIAVLCWVQAIAMALAAFIVNLPTAILFAIVFGIGFGGRIPASNAIRGDFFGRRAFATIMGISAVPMAGFSVVAPTLSGVIFDARESYFLAFMAIAASSVLAGCFLIIAKKPHMSDEQIQ